MFGNHTWHNLQVLRLDGMFNCEGGLAGLLERHPTLEYLELHNIALWQGAFQGLFTTFAELPLVEVRMWGVLPPFKRVENHGDSTLEMTSIFSHGLSNLGTSFVSVL